MIRPTAITASDWRATRSGGSRTAYDTERLGDLARAGHHRDAVGGLWDQVGSLTFEFLEDHGLEPEMQVLDIGCGALRVGIHLVGYLEPGCYYGVDPVAELLDAGYNVELTNAGVQQKLPRDHLVQTRNFQFERLPTNRPFEVAVAQSVFSHLPSTDLRRCMIRLTECTLPGSRFFMTVFHCPDNRSWLRPLEHEPGGVTTYPTRNPYHYRLADLRGSVDGLPWRLDDVQQWGHPRAQKMVTYTRTPA